MHHLTSATHDALQYWWRHPAAMPARRHRERKPSIRAMIRAVEKEGKSVTSATWAADGSVSLQFGEAKTEPKSETDRELAEFEARHAKA